MSKNQNINTNIERYQGYRPEVGERVFVHPSATVIGEVRLGDDVSVWPGVVIRGDVNHIRIGVGSNIQDISILHGCTIEDECLIGMGSIVMDKVVVQKYVLVGAGSLVPEGKLLESGYLYLGSPVRKVRKLTDQELAHFMYSAEHYMRLKNNYINEASEK